MDTYSEVLKGHLSANGYAARMHAHIATPGQKYLSAAGLRQRWLGFARESQVPQLLPVWVNLQHTPDELREPYVCHVTPDELRVCRITSDERCVCLPNSERMPPLVSKLQGVSISRFPSSHVARSCIPHTHLPCLMRCGARVCPDMDRRPSTPSSLWKVTASLNGISPPSGVARRKVMKLRLTAQRTTSVRPLCSSIQGSVEGMRSYHKRRQWQ